MRCFENIIEVIDHSQMYILYEHNHIQIPVPFKLPLDPY